MVTEILEIIYLLFLSYFAMDPVSK